MSDAAQTQYGPVGIDRVQFERAIKFRNERIVFDRDRVSIGMPTVSFYRVQPAVRDPSRGLFSDETIILVEGPLDCYHRAPNEEERMSGLFMDTDQIVVVYGADPSIEYRVVLSDSPNDQFIISSKRFNSVSFRCDLVVRPGKVDLG